MTATESAALVGTVVSLATENTLGVHVRIVNVKSAYGTIRYLVTPVAGTGETWVYASRCNADLGALVPPPEFYYPLP